MVNGTETSYLARLPAVVPAGLVLVHNHVYPVVRRHAVRGSRMWLQAPDPARLEACGCGWAAELGPHFKVRGIKARGKAKA